jgi:hypothetical protein
MTKSAKPTSSKQKGKLHKFVGRDRIEEHLSQNDRAYRFLFFLSFSLNVIWFVIFLFLLYWLYTPYSDNVIINNGLKRYCDPNGKIAEFYNSESVGEPNRDVWQRVCEGPSASSANE